MTRAPLVHARAAFSLVELLVSLSLLGVGAAGLAAALAGDRHLRDLAAAHAGAAGRARVRVEALAARACGSDTAGRSAEPWGAESWRATAVNGAWRLTDSLRLARSHAVLVIEARIACPE